jgi:3-oxoacyl-[acyl-carrier protein] reductase
MRLKDKVTVVTGGARGIGRCIAELFAREGATVIAADVMEPSAPNSAVADMRLDVSDRRECENFFNEALERFERIDVLVNNAGLTRDGLTRKMSDEMWDRVLDVDLTGVFNITRHVGPHMQERGRGSIINISSVVGEYGNIGQANYAAAKSGLFGLTKSWAKEFAMKGADVRVNAIAPGYVLTDILKTVPQELLDKFSAQTMLGRLGQPMEIAKAALFLASEDASYVTGHVLSVNGGMRL